MGARSMTSESQSSTTSQPSASDTKKVLDLSIYWKTLTSQYYEFLSKVVSDPIMKQRFRLMASEERDHRKILVVDGELAFTGGMNIRNKHIAVRGVRPAEVCQCVR